MVKLYRTTGEEPKAILSSQKHVLITDWHQLLDLRELVSLIPAEAAHVESSHVVEEGDWSATPSNLGITLTAPSDEELHFEAEEWETLARLLYVGDVLLMQVDVAEIAGKPQPRVAEAIKQGELFAFQIPGAKTRQWRIPRLAAVEWAS